ncbi:hypothetical protein LO763_22525 [Glycomyces sp. A-F 0318]|uniref:hypothetical protein n=1 Tax=Glycomyces amatae TaxID=2881355 RepID=UPI001E639B00|nr:hypothetical protein [Glycomyces amatae]MCD0446395.1 hypothetical protein [Glycomyces amatae]
MKPPMRAEVERQWVDLIRGEITREQAHAWAKPWVEEFFEQVDPTIENVLQSLHGFDMVYTDPERTWIAHGGPGVYVHDAAWIRESFERWKTR